MKMKNIAAVAMVGCMAASLAACGSSAASTDTAASSSAATAESTEATEATGASADGFTVQLGPNPETLDPALNSSVDGANTIITTFEPLLLIDENNEIVPGQAELPEVSDDGLTWTFTMKDGLKWSDGSDLTAKDFEYSFKRLASPDTAAPYGETVVGMIDGYDDAIGNPDADGNTTTDPDWDALNVHASEDGKTLTVQLSYPCSYFDKLCAFAAMSPVQEATIEANGDAWCTEPDTYVCNGPYTMESWEHNSVITLVKNPNFYDADEITMETINFYLSDDVNNMLSNFKNGDWELIDDVPTNEIASLKAEYPDEFVVAGQIGTYYVCWNINEDILPASSTLTGAEAEQAKAEIRNAIGLLFDRNYIVEEIGQAGQIPASSFVAMGMTNPDGTQFYETAGHSDDYVGYYDVSADAYESNFESAVETLKKYYTYDESTGMFTDFPTLTYLYNTSEAHKAIGEYLQSAMAAVGITMNLENQEWATFLNTRKAGDYSIARNGWVADYNDPICFLDMWVTNSGNNDVQFGKGNAADAKVYSLDLTSYGYDTKVENGTWAETYDVLISDIKSCTDPETRYALMHEAEDLLMSTGCIVPLYYYTDIYMLDSNIHGFFSNPLGYKYFMYCTIG